MATTELTQERTWNGRRVRWARTGSGPDVVFCHGTPWSSQVWQAQAFYRQIAQADQSFTDDVQPRYPKLDLPVLIVWGADDNWLPVDQARTLAELIPGARLRLIPEAGHLIQFDQPERLAVTLYEWLSGFTATRDA